MDISMMPERSVSDLAILIWVAAGASEGAPFRSLPNAALKSRATPMWLAASGRFGVSAISKIVSFVEPKIDASGVPTLIYSSNTRMPE